VDDVNFLTGTDSQECCSSSANDEGNWGKSHFFYGESRRTGKKVLRYMSSGTATRDVLGSRNASAYISLHLLDVGRRIVSLSRKVMNSGCIPYSYTSSIFLMVWMNSSDILDNSREQHNEEPDRLKSFEICV